MGITQDLLHQSHRLAIHGGLHSTQADYRRAVSAAYYAIFHLIGEECGQRWLGASPEAETAVQRALDHVAVRNVSGQFKNVWRSWSGANIAVPPPLERFASTVTNLQIERHSADYDNSRNWTEGEVLDRINSAEYAVHDWLSVREEPIAGDYLLAILLGKRR